MQLHPTNQSRPPTDPLLVIPTKHATTQIITALSLPQHTLSSLVSSSKPSIPTQLQHQQLPRNIPVPTQHQSLQDKFYLPSPLIATSLSAASPNQLHLHATVGPDNLD